MKKRCTSLDVQRFSCYLLIAVSVRRPISTTGTHGGAITYPMIVLGIATLSIADTGTATDSAIVQHSTATAAGNYAKAPAVSFLTCLGTTVLKEFAAADDSQFLFGDFFFGCFKISLAKFHTLFFCKLN